MEQKPQFTANAKKNQLDLDYFPSKKRAVNTSANIKVDSGATTDRGYADSCADSASKMSMDSARQMIAVYSPDKNAQDNLEIAHRIR